MERSSSLYKDKPSPPSRRPVGIMKTSISEFPKLINSINASNSFQTEVKNPVCKATMADKIRKQLEEKAVAEAAQKAEKARLAAKLAEERSKTSTVPSYFNNRYRNDDYNEYDGYDGYDGNEYDIQDSRDIDDLDYVAPHMVGQKKSKFVVVHNDDYYDENQNDIEEEINSELYDY